MTEENKIEEEHKCFCRSKSFKKFLITTCGTFVGVFLALCLFAATHKPPMPAPIPMAPCPCAGYHQMIRPYGPPPHHHHFDKGHRGDFHKKMMKQRMEHQGPGPVQRIDD